MSMTLGTLQHIVDLRQEAHGLTGMAHVRAKLRELNFAYYWDGRRAEQKPTGTNWEQVNKHLWRIRAMYEGGDCFLANWPGATPNQKLWPTRTFRSTGSTHTLPGYSQPSSLW